MAAPAAPRTGGSTYEVPRRPETLVAGEAAGYVRTAMVIPTTSFSSFLLLLMQTMHLTPCLWKYLTRRFRDRLVVFYLVALMTPMRLDPTRKIIPSRYLWA